MAQRAAGDPPIRVNSRSVFSEMRLPEICDCDLSIKKIKKVIRLITIKYTSIRCTGSVKENLFMWD